MIVSDKHINPENSSILKCDFGDGDIYEHVCACVFTMFSGEITQTL